MKILSSEDCVLCLAVLLKYRTHLNEIMEMLPPDRRTEIEGAATEMSSLSEQQMKDEFDSLAAAEYTLAVNTAKREFGVDIKNVPPVLRDWMLRNSA